VVPPHAAVPLQLSSVILVSGLLTLFPLLPNGSDQVAFERSERFSSRLAFRLTSLEIHLGRGIAPSLGLGHSMHHCVQTAIATSIQPMPNLPG
jgi:hypothetical protein